MDADRNGADGVPSVRLADPSRWAVVRDLRLRALREAPEAFLQHDGETGWGEHDWVATFTTGCWAVAEADAGTVGLARLTHRGPPHEGEPPHVESVWVDPAHRRHRVASALVAFLTTQALPPGEPEVLVWVIEPNPEALALYEHLGFERTGEVQPWGDSGVRVEVRLRIRVPQPR